MNPTDPNPFLPCPFCGKPPKSAQGSTNLMVFCPRHTDPMPLKAWNTRAPSAELTQAQALVTQLSAEREHNANEALAMRAERDEARRELAHLEPLISKCAEAMGFIRLAAICLKLNGSQWSEEPGFTVPMNSALLKLCAERDAANALVDRLAGVLEKAERIMAQLYNSYFFDMLKEWEEDALKPALAEVAKSLSPHNH